jgi:hypothetical protein
MTHWLPRNPECHCWLRIHRDLLSLLGMAQPYPEYDCEQVYNCCQPYPGYDHCLRSNTSQYYGDCVKLCKDFAWNFGDTAPSHTDYHHPTRLALHLATFLCSAISTQRRWSKQNRRRCWALLENTTSRMHFKGGRSPGKVRTRGREQLWRWWWLVGPKLVFILVATLSQEIMDSSGTLRCGRRL